MHGGLDGPLGRAQFQGQLGVGPRVVRIQQMRAHRGELSHRLGSRFGMLSLQKVQDAIDEYNRPILLEHLFRRHPVGGFMQEIAFGVLQICRAEHKAAPSLHGLRSAAMICHEVLQCAQQKGPEFSARAVGLFEKFFGDDLLEESLGDVGRFVTGKTLSAGVGIKWVLIGTAQFLQRPYSFRGPGVGGGGDHRPMSRVEVRTPWNPVGRVCWHQQ